MPVHSMADVDDMLIGRVERTAIGTAQLAFFVQVTRGHDLTFSIMMNATTKHSTCTVIFSVVGLLVSFLLTFPRRLEKVSPISHVRFVSSIGAVVTGMIGVTLSGQDLFIPQACHPSPRCTMHILLPQMSFLHSPVMLHDSHAS
jgi:hypothetical protein